MANELRRRIKRGNGALPNITVASSRTEFYGSVTAENFFDSFQHFKAETRTVLSAPSPLVCAVVGSIVKKLGDNVAVGTMYYMIVHEFKTFRSVTMKKFTFGTIKSSLFSVDSSFSILLNDDHWIFDGSWLSICYLSGSPNSSEPLLLTLTNPGTPGRKRNLPPLAEIAEGA